MTHITPEVQVNIASHDTASWPVLMKMETIDQWLVLTSVITRQT